MSHNTPEPVDIDYTALRIDGTYRQNNNNDLMLRIKIPAGLLSVEQVRKICDLSDRFGHGHLHLSSRASIELHWLRHENLAEAQEMLQAVGLGSRGAGGGAVRGVTCDSIEAENIAITGMLARKLQAHFTGNPHAEGVPKKFKIGVFGSEKSGRHLIQDVGLTYAGTTDQGHLYDTWVAGGLGRQPTPGFLWQRAVPEERLIPLIEALITVYRARTPKGKRLKHLVAQIGQDALRTQVASVVPQDEPPQVPHATEALQAKRLGQSSSTDLPQITIFAGELTSESFRILARIAEEQGTGFLALNAEQNVVFPCRGDEMSTAIRSAIARHGFDAQEAEKQVQMRVCTGAPRCPKGLVPTVEVARRLIATMGPKASGACWALSGCPNACSQPQLANFGIMPQKLETTQTGERLPRFALLARTGAPFGEVIADNLSPDDLLKEIEKLETD